MAVCLVCQIFYRAVSEGYGEGASGLIRGAFEGGLELV